MARTKKYDLFVSHASEDKDAVVFPLMARLWELGVWAVWLDEIVLEPSDSIREGIDKGLNDSRNILLVLSKQYFTKHWTGLEFNAALSLRRKLIPIWHDVTAPQVRKFSPILSAIKGVHLEAGIAPAADAIVAQLAKDKNSSYSRNENTRHAQLVFWEMLRCYVKYELGILPRSANRGFNEIGEGELPNWKDHCRKETGLNRKKILEIKERFPFLSDDQLVTAVVALAKESARENNTWTPEEPGLEEVMALIDAHEQGS